MTEVSGSSAGGTLKAGDRVLVGRHFVSVSDEFAESLLPGDEVLGIAGSGALRRIPKDVAVLVDNAVSLAVEAFTTMSAVTDESITLFFHLAAGLLADDSVFEAVRIANERDVENARLRGRSTTRLVLSDSMRTGMIEALKMWEQLDVHTQDKISTIEHDGWRVEQWSAPLGVLAFVFEGRPNVFADATGVLRSGNTVVFRIGSDALGTARALMEAIIAPALQSAGLPVGAVQLVDSPEHAAGWALFSDPRVSLAVARGSGEAVAELGAIAQQVGTPVSLHGTGGAWIIAGKTASATALADAVEHSLDRKVCNTVNVVCVMRETASIHVPLVFEAAEKAALARNTHVRIHSVGGAHEWLQLESEIDVVRAAGVQREKQVTIASETDLSNEWEWEETPEIFVVVAEDIEHASRLFNTYSPQFVVSIITEQAKEFEGIWSQINAPFVGNGFTRWVDGQFALKRPELGLSNWQNGRLFGRSGVLSGDSAFTVRLRVIQDRSDIHR
jgi:glutamate-5-semialdehyde dehydrogenase